MTKTLMGAVLKPGGQISATYQFTAFGATKVGKKETGWSTETKDALTAFLAACESDLGVITEAQIYAPITDPIGYPGFSGPGECIDLTYTPNNDPPQIRIGDDEVVPVEIAEARDAIKAAITNDL